MTRKPGYYDYDAYTQIVDQIEHLRLHSKIQFTGVGEPLLHPRIFDMIRYASDRGFFTLMNTNATILTREKADQLVDSGLDYLHISLDGLTPDTYEKIRVGASFKRVLHNIFHLFEARHGKKGYHLAVILGIVHQKMNTKEVEQFVDYFSQYPFHHVVAGELFNHMGAIEEANLKYADKKEMDLDLYPVCNTPWDLLSINCDGKVVGCNYDFDNRYVVGDTRKDPLLDIWNGKGMQHFRHCVLERTYNALEEKGSLCSECSIKWQPDYHIPRDFYSEVSLMEDYLVKAIRRCAGSQERNLKFREKEKRLFQRKQALLSELNSFKAS